MESLFINFFGRREHLVLSSSLKAVDIQNHNIILGIQKHISTKLTLFNLSEKVTMKSNILSNLQFSLHSLYSFNNVDSCYLLTSN